MSFAMACWWSVLLLVISTASAENDSIYFINATDPTHCNQVALTNGNTTTLTEDSAYGCNIWSVSKCGVAAAAAGLGCGLPIGYVAGCWVASLWLIPGCLPCFCSSLRCPSWCPCEDQSDAFPQEHPGSFNIGTCANVGYTEFVEQNDYNVTWPAPVHINMQLFKKPLVVV